MRNQEHAKRRAELEAARAERRRMLEEEERQRKRKRSSSAIPAKWRLTGGIKIGGVAVRGGMFYSGHNMSEMVSPSISEPSMLDPVHKVAPTSDGARVLGSFPCYQYLSEEQRKGYIDFLASDRTEASDIGYVFLYLYGFERRLVLDAARPDTVDDDERAKLTDELLRLLEMFGPSSPSLTHYIGTLLLFDGYVFESRTPEEIDEIFHRGADDEKTWMRRFELTDNFPAMSYMMMSRLMAAGIEPSTKELAAFAKGRLMSSNHFDKMGIVRQTLFDDAYDRLLELRLSHVDLNSESVRKAAKAPAAYPQYFPASPSLRRTPQNVGARCRGVVETALPVKSLCDIVLTARKDMDVLDRVLESPALRGIDEVSFDTFKTKLGASNPLAKHLSDKTAATYVPMALFEQAAEALGVEFSYTSKGLLTQSAQDLIAQLAASCGWQAVLPDIIQCRASMAWKYGADMDIVLFKRGVVYSTKSGKQGLGTIFGGDENMCEMALPAKWDEAIALAYIFAWFVKNSPVSLSNADVTMFSSSHYPPFSASGNAKKNQIALFFSVMYATYGAGLSTHGIKNCLEAVPFSAVQDLMFSVCSEKFGNLVPQDVMEAMEKLYERAGIDKSMVLYDYHAGDYRVSHDDTVDAAEFSIDEDKLAQTISSTSDVHSILNEAMVGDEEEYVAQETAEEAVPAPLQDEPEGSDAPPVSLERLQEIFGGSDEMPSSDFIDAIKEEMGLGTTMEAMAAISEINMRLGDVVEIDGPDAYLDI